MNHKLISAGCYTLWLDINNIIFNTASPTSFKILRIENYISDYFLVHLRNEKAQTIFI
jgi:hypothetical protein